MARLCADENVAWQVSTFLAAQWHQIDRVQELGRAGLGDAQHLLYAARDNRVLVTHNTDEFLLLHRAWIAWERQ
jgi:predicted nuclease of predicted toxin-antitoxin system